MGGGPYHVSARLLSPLVGGGAAEAELAVTNGGRVERFFCDSASDISETDSEEDVEEGGAVRLHTTEVREKAALKELLRASVYAWEERSRYDGMQFFNPSLVTPREADAQGGLNRRGTMNPIARVLLAGAADDDSDLACLAGIPEVVEMLFRATRALWAQELAEKADPKFAAFSLVHEDIDFPRPTGLDVNMMPFLLGREETLPEELRGYWHMIEACCNPQDEGKVAYLTVQESEPEAGRSQRRAGVHTEGFLRCEADAGRGRCVKPTRWHHWGSHVGRRMEDGQFNGGVFMASNISGTTRLWDVELPRDAGGASHYGGDAEHLRGVLTTGAIAIEPRANELFWMTDATPHESLPLPKEAEGKTRQFFRVVAGEVSVWWAAHSTPNPTGVVPPPNVTILTHSKFGTDDNV